ncbi:hypothetical protein NADFUDRAFT_51042 [Nadsonia fulvescens var. elongata DSM 6958]|uniref:Nucleoporin Pom152 n=1 Tax=Nadsonia fulvescens var. elongata DSM 6958 TaxID=857566 RepID=A0A1E3PLD6_9ASCO|nr:hypothetical protein NADFUDRAFT_51042 [Nadsonia fulvescens var. elongata DSM 6958]
MSFLNSEYTGSNRPWNTESYRVKSENGSGFRDPTEKPWHKPNVYDFIQSGPLIPESYMQVSQQRLVAISLFVLLQAFKIYHFILLLNDRNPQTQFYFLVQFALLDSLFIWLLPVFRIPWLIFSKRVIATQVFAIVAFDLYISTATSIPVLPIILSISKSVFDREISVTGSKVRPRDILDSKSHFSGKHIVQILPESTALFNPFSSSYCFDGSESSIKIPIRVNSSEPAELVQIKHIKFDTLEESFLNFTLKDLKRMKTDTLSYASRDNILDSEKISYLEVSIDQPGLYRLAQVKTSHNMGMRLYQKDVLVTNCPTGYILSSNEGEADSLDRCVGGTDAPRIIVNGVPPMKVKYSRSIGGKEKSFLVQSVQPDHHKSPLSQGGLPKNGYIWKQPASLDWASSKTVELDLDSNLGITGQWMFNIDEVQDALGNLVNFTQLYQSREQAKILSSQSLSYGFMVHPRPKVRYQSCSIESPVKIAKGKTAEVPLIITGEKNDGPYEVTFEYTSPDENPDALLNTFTKNFTRQNGWIAVNKAGLLKIKSIRGAYCEGDVLDSSTCLSLIPAEPSLDVSFEKINDKCAGSIGVTADLSFTGTPPFMVSYRVIKDGRVLKTKTESILQARHQIEFKPESAGTYAYEFFSLDDHIYKGLPLNAPTYRVEQTVRPLAGASFVQRNLRKRCCSGQSVDFDVHLQGSGPFTLTYQIMHGTGHGDSKREVITVNDIQGPLHKIVTPQLKSGGSYTVSLVSVQDFNGCKTNLGEADAFVEVRRQRPSGNFLPLDGTMNVKTLENYKVNLPLKLSGEGPWTVEYSFENTDGIKQNKQINVRHANGESIRVSEAGKYKLLSIKDAYCPGDVNDESIFSISWFDKPTLKLATESSKKLLQKSERSFIKNEICEGDEDFLDLELKGSAPLTVYYDLQGPSDLKKKEIQVATKFASIPMESETNGIYHYNIKGVTDSIYDMKLLNRKDFLPISVTQKVNKRPSAAFAEIGRVYKSCLHSSFDDDTNKSADTTEEPIAINLDGKAPFELTLNVRHESNGIEEVIYVKDIEKSIFVFSDIYKSLGLGRHTVSIINLLDGNGCSRDVFSDLNKITIHVSDIPTIAPVSPMKDFCVGDRISYLLSGSMPFQLTYSFNGQKQNVKTDSKFSRIANSPGKLSIISLSDHASKCKVNVEGQYVVNIHELPSAFTSDGTSLIQDVMGDQAEVVFTFKGTPPFTFTYVRTEIIDGHEKIMERNTIPNVMEHEYSIFTTKQGTYEAISVRDAFCTTFKDDKR